MGRLRENVEGRIRGGSQKREGGSNIRGNGGIQHRVHAHGSHVPKGMGNRGTRVGVGPGLIMATLSEPRMGNRIPIESGGGSRAISSLGGAVRTWSVPILHQRGGRRVKILSTNTGSNTISSDDRVRIPKPNMSARSQRERARKVGVDSGLDKPLRVCISSDFSRAMSGSNGQNGR
jgi:hypothetical protein